MKYTELKKQSTASANGDLQSRDMVGRHVLSRLQGQHGQLLTAHGVSGAFEGIFAKSFQSISSFLTMCKAEAAWRTDNHSFAESLIVQRDQHLWRSLLYCKIICTYL